MTKRPSRPIESFGAEMLQTLIQGSQNKIEVPLPYRKAIQFTQRLYLLRAAMRRDGHPFASATQQCQIRLSWPSDTETVASSKNVKRPKDRETLCTVTIAPADDEFSAILKTAGVRVPELQPAPAEGSNLSELDPLAAFLRNPEPEKT